MSASDLEGDVTLRVQLPTGRVVFFTAASKTPMMDILIRLSTQFGFSPSSYTLKVPSDRPYNTHSPNTPIGRLPTAHLEVVHKTSELSSEKPRKQAGSNNGTAVPFEPTIRIQADFPKKLKTFLRVSPKSSIGEIHWELCRQQDFDPQTLVICDVRRPDTPLSADCTLADSGATHFLLLPSSAASLHRSTGDLFGDFSRMSVDEKERVKRKGGLFSTVFGKKKRAPSKPDISDRVLTQQISRTESLTHGNVQILTEKRPNGVNFVSSKHNGIQTDRPKSMSAATEASKKRQAPAPPPNSSGRSKEMNGKTSNEVPDVSSGRVDRGGSIDRNLSVEIHQPSFSAEGEETADNLSPLKSDQSCSISPDVSHLSSSKSSIAAGDDAFTTNRKLMKNGILNNQPIREQSEHERGQSLAKKPARLSETCQSNENSPTKATGTPTSSSTTMNNNSDYAQVKKKKRAPPPPGVNGESPSPGSSTRGSDAKSQQNQQVSPPTTPNISSSNTNTSYNSKTIPPSEGVNFRLNSTTASSVDVGANELSSTASAEGEIGTDQETTANGKVSNPEEYEELQHQKRAERKNSLQQQQHQQQEQKQSQLELKNEQQLLECYQSLRAEQHREQSTETQQQSLADQAPTSLLSTTPAASLGRIGHSSCKSVNSPQVPTLLSSTNYEHSSSSSRFPENAKDYAVAVDVDASGTQLGKDYARTETNAGSKSSTAVLVGSKGVAGRNAESLLVVESLLFATGDNSEVNRGGADIRRFESSDPESGEILLSTSRIGLNFVNTQEQKQGSQGLNDRVEKNNTRGRGSNPDTAFDEYSSSEGRRIGPEDIQVVDEDDLLKSKQFRTSSTTSSSEREQSFAGDGNLLNKTGAVGLSGGTPFAQTHNIILKTTNADDFQISPKSDVNLDLDITPFHPPEPKYPSEKVYLQTFASEVADLRSSADSGIGSPSVDDKHSLSSSSTDGRSLPKKTNLYLKNQNQPFNNNSRLSSTQQTETKTGQFLLSNRSKGTGSDSSQQSNGDDMPRFSSSAAGDGFSSDYDYRRSVGMFPVESNMNHPANNSQYSSIDNGTESDFGFSSADLQYMHQIVQASGRNQVSGSIYAPATDISRNYQVRGVDNSRRTKEPAATITKPQLENLQQRLHAEYDKLQEMFIGWQAVLSEQKEAFETKTRISPHNFAKFQSIQEDLYQQHNLVQYLCSLAQQEDDSGSESGQHPSQQRSLAGFNNFATPSLSQQSNQHRALNIQPDRGRMAIRPYGSDKSSSSAPNSGLSSPDQPSNSSSGEAVNYVPPVRDSFTEQIRRKSRSGWSGSDDVVNEVSMVRSHEQLISPVSNHQFRESQNYTEMVHRRSDSPRQQPSFGTGASQLTSSITVNNKDQYQQKPHGSFAVAATGNGPKHWQLRDGNSEVVVGNRSYISPNADERGPLRTIVDAPGRFNVGPGSRADTGGDRSSPNWAHRTSQLSPREVEEQMRKSETLPRSSNKTKQGHLVDNDHFTSSMDRSPSSTGEVFRSVKSYTNNHPNHPKQSDYSGGYYASANGINSGNTGTLPNARHTSDSQQPKDIVDTSSVIRPSMLRSTSGRVLEAQNSSSQNPPFKSLQTSGNNFRGVGGRFSPSSVMGGNLGSMTLMLDARSPSPAVFEPMPIRNYGLRNSNDAASSVIGPIAKNRDAPGGNPDSGMKFQSPSPSPVIHKYHPLASPKSEKIRSDHSQINTSTTTNNNNAALDKRGKFEDNNQITSSATGEPNKIGPIGNRAKPFQPVNSQSYQPSSQTTDVGGNRFNGLNSSSVKKAEQPEITKSDPPSTGHTQNSHHTPSSVNRTNGFPNKNITTTNYSSKPTVPSSGVSNFPTKTNTPSPVSTAPPKAPPPPAAPAAPPILAQMAAVKLKPAGERKIKGSNPQASGGSASVKSGGQAFTPTVDPHDQLLASIRSFGGTRGLKKSPVSAHSTAAVQ